MIEHVEFFGRTPGRTSNGPLRPLQSGNTLPIERSSYASMGNPTRDTVRAADRDASPALAGRIEDRDK